MVLCCTLLLGRSLRLHAVQGFLKTISTIATRAAHLALNWDNHIMRTRWKKRNGKKENRETEKDEFFPFDKSISVRIYLRRRNKNDPPYLNSTNSTADTLLKRLEGSGFLHLSKTGRQLSTNTAEQEGRLLADTLEGFTRLLVAAVGENRLETGRRKHHNKMITNNEQLHNRSSSQKGTTKTQNAMHS